MDLYSHPLCRRKGGIPILFGSASLLPAAGINQGSSTLCIGFRLHSKHSCGSGPFQLANGWMAPYSCGGDLKFAATSTAEGMVISCQGRCAIAANEKRRNTSDPAKPLIFISLPPREDGVDYNKFQESSVSFKSGPTFRKAVTRRHTPGYASTQRAARWRALHFGCADELYVLASNEIEVAVSFTANTPGPPLVGVGIMDEGSFVEGRWVQGRSYVDHRTSSKDAPLLLPGALHRIAGSEHGILRVRLYRYE
jgi:hypothetical protein